ncbi:glycosyl hydrolase family 2 [Mobilisporobacter senegalensis]|uniref:Glycosyl hydrolase family 2 n=1 Tax=Mobilisporobacter senegalensis TaxID=1329262 RepID=A0A3N1XLD4_9FIRM|nr:PA14 domain-containing protein [Mobilisporobacter senegalensis]ROR27510.1 glycosyl hydrolase family 2 [Mobilisporobacter senegalensis]
MKHRVFSALLVVVLILNTIMAPQVVNAQEDKTMVESVTEPGLRAEYYRLDVADLTLEEKTNEKTEGNINYPLGNNNLATVLKEQAGQSNHVGIRWSGKLVVPETGYYTFYTFTDDGSKLWIDGNVIIDYWKVSWEEEQTSEKIYLEQGEEYDFRFDYMQYTGGQCATLSWSNDVSISTKTIIPQEAFYQPDPVVVEPEPLKTEYNGLQGEYYRLAPSGTTGKMDVIAFGELMTTCVDDNIYYNSMENILLEQTGVKDKAGVRWTANLVAPADGYYTFHVYSDNGIKISLDGKQILSWWKNEWDKWQQSSEVYLNAGEAYPFKFDYFEWDGGSHVELLWSMKANKGDATGEKEKIPDEVFYLPNTYKGAIVNSIDTTGAVLNIDDGLSGTMDILGAGFSEENDIKVEVISSSGSVLVNRVMLTVKEITENRITVEVPDNLRIGRYRLKVSSGNVTVKTKGAEGIFSVITNNKTYSDRPEFPNPEWSRKDGSGADDNWLSLNGLWNFEFDPAEVGQAENWYSVEKEFSREINVPFCWESPYSGITDTSYRGQAWYQKEITLNRRDWEGKQVILKFGAVDWKCKLWVNGQEVGVHEGGYTAFEMDISKYINLDATNIITLWVEDKSSYGDNSYPALVGKQGWNAPCGYTHTSGIWQSVYLEGRKSKTTIEYAHANPDIDNRTVQFNLKINNAENEEFTVEYDFKSILYDQELEKDIETGSVFRGEQTINIKADGSVVALDPIHIENQKLWDYNEPNLYEGTFILKNSAGIVLDKVSTYFGQRKISTGYYTDKVGAKYIYLNNQPVYLSGLLDQGFWQEGVYTAPSEAALKFDIQKMRSLGFNMIRKHLKIEDPLQYYWADKLGMFIWQDMPHATAMCPTREGADAPGRDCYEYALESMVNKNYNHPSIIAIMLFNETWGLQEAYFNNKQEVKARDGLNTLEWVRAMYDKVKGINPNILVEDMSPCNFDHIQPSDLNTWHMYPKGYASSKDFVDRFVTNTFEGSNYNYKFGYKNDGDPFLNSEYGGVAAYDGDWDVSWCFKYQTDIQRQYDKLSGFVYTEPYDIEYERNGVLTYDRRVKVFGYEEIAYGGDMSIKDLLQEEYIGLDVDPAKVMKPGAIYTAPVITMRWSPENLTGQHSVKWRFDGTDVYGNNITTNLSGSFNIDFKPYTRESNTIKFKLPGEECVGTITVWIEDETGKSIAKNFVNVIVSDNKSLTGIESVDEDTLVLRSEVKENEVKSAGKLNFTYTLPSEFDITRLNSLRIIAEASSLKGATLNNSANAQTTIGSELPSDVTVSINGIEVETVGLKDNPRDIRGTLTLPKGLNGGSSAGNYGYLINLNAAKDQVKAIQNTLVSNNQLVVTYEVKENAANPNGVRIYGDNEGRYAVNPTIILNPQDNYVKDITVNNETKEIMVMENNNYSVEGQLTDRTGIIARYTGTNGYYVHLEDNGTKLVLSTLDGTELGRKEEIAMGSHYVKVTLFDDHIKVFTDNDPEPVIDIYDYSKFTGNVAVKALTNTTFEEIVISPETYKKNDTIVKGQADIQFVDHFNTEDTFTRRYEPMGDDIKTSTKNGMLELTANLGDKVILREIEAQDLVLEADVSVTSTIYDGNIGFVFRGTEWSVGSDGAKGYYAGYGIDGENGFINLGRMDGGSWKQLGRVTIGKESYGTIHRLKVAAIGSRICVYLDDETTPRIDVYDSYYNSGGIALRGFKATGGFDNVVVSTAPRYQSDFEKDRLDEWQTLGDWRIENGSLTGAASGSAILVGNGSWNDYQVSSNITLKEGAIPGIAVRAELKDDKFTGYKAVLDQTKNKVQLLLSQQGKEDKLLASKSYDLQVDNSYDVTVRTINSDLYVLIDGKRVIHMEDNSLSQGKAGFISNGGSGVFDNIIVTEKFLYEEDFAEGSLNGWNIIEGDFSVNDNTLFIPEGKGLKMVDGYATWDNYVLSAKIKLSATKNVKSNAGFVFRASDFTTGADNLRGFVAGVNYNSNLSDIEGASGVELGDLHYGWRQIKNQKQVMENNRWYELEVKVNGNKITVSLDGTLCYEVEDNAYKYGMFGLRNYQTDAYMKDLKVVPFDLYGIIEEDPEEDDIEKPSAPTDIIVTDITETSATVRWKESTDNVGVIGYEVSVTGDYPNQVVSGAGIGLNNSIDVISGSSITLNNYTEVVSGSSIYLNNLLEGTGYTVSIKALDEAGNQSDPGIAEFTTKRAEEPVDTEQPSTPDNLLVFDITKTTARISWDESTDNVGVAGYEVSLDKDGWSQVVTANTVSLNNLRQGTEYTVTIVALDGAGNRSAAGSISFVTQKDNPTNPGNGSGSDPQDNNNSNVPKSIIYEDTNLRAVTTAMIKWKDGIRIIEIESMVTDKQRGVIFNLKVTLDMDGRVLSSESNITCSISDSKAEKNKTLLGINIAEQVLDRTIEQQNQLLGEFSTISIKDIPIDLTIKITKKEIMEIIQKRDIKNIILDIQLPENETLPIKNLILDKEIINALNQANSVFVISIKDIKGRELYSWNLDGAKLDDKDIARSDLNLILQLGLARSLPENKNTLLSVLKKDKNNSINNSLVLSFSTTDDLIGFSKLRINVASDSLKAGSKLYLYAFNEKSKKLEEQTNNSYIIDKDGFITIQIKKGGDYVLLLKRPSNTITTTLLSKVKMSVDNVSASKKTLYLRSKKEKTATIKITLPGTLLKVNKFSKTIKDGWKEEVKITFTSSNKSVAAVSSKGVITGKKKGKATITTNILLRNGSKKTYKTIITVK